MDTTLFRSPYPSVKGGLTTPCQEIWACPSGSNSVYPIELDGILCNITFHLVVALQGHTEFCNRDHVMRLKEVRSAIQLRNTLTLQQALANVMGTLLPPEAHCMCRCTKTVTWISVQPSTVNGAELGDQ